MSRVDAVAYEHYFTARVPHGDWLDGVVMYDVEVSTNLPEYGARVIKVVKRFSEFAELHKHLKLLDPQMPALPGKALFTTENTIRQRSEAFEAFLNYIGRNPRLRVSPECRRFLYMLIPDNQRIRNPMTSTPESFHTAPTPTMAEEQRYRTNFQDQPKEEQMQEEELEEEPEVEELPPPPIEPLVWYVSSPPPPQ
eukprot:6685311-Pyramimonas_sp.AAC.1